MTAPASTRSLVPEGEDVGPGDVPAPPPRTSAPHRLTDRLRGALDALPPAERAGVVRLLTLAALLPVLLLIARRTAQLPYGASLLTVYGLTVLSGTACLLYAAYARYDDPAVRTMRHRAPHHAAFPALPARPRVSFLLAVKDEAGNIEACVRSMAASDCPGLQIIVVDDGSRDGTGDILDGLADELGITVIRLEQNVGKKAALVRGCAVADGDVLVFTDSDCVIAPDAVRLCVEAMVRHPDLGAVSGHCRALNARTNLLTRLQDVWYDGQFRVAKAAESAFGSVTCVSGPLAAFRREAVVNYLPAWAGDRFAGAPFRFATDRQLTGYVLGQRWRGAALKRRHADSPFVTEHDHPERRWQVGYSHAARVWTNVPARWRPFLHQQVRWKKSFVRSLFFTGGFMWRRGPAPALLYYGHALWVLAAPALVFWHLVCAPLGQTAGLTLLYLCGVLLKGVLWGLAYRLGNPGDRGWRHRPLMSLLCCCVLAWLLPYAVLTLRRGIWTRSPA
ncbi:glycosyltransferase family 2 protein [Streptomyces poonensis]|uniref:Hyaluronan synthase n=1 Tax=Streptomyces poonensis TaxID=68255 RepID=A0A918PBU0_9ACTN|nr:glycosyltransferase [Streptomyces poonensis]GGY95357.1 glycosyl transferase [Streptomyces poonensis]GLJ88808.1 glycosyl transferase [Streptomyces poonensis]